MSVLHQPGHIALTRSCGCARAHTRVCADIAILLRGAGYDEEQEARCDTFVCGMIERLRVKCMGVWLT